MLTTPRPDLLPGSLPGRRTGDVPGREPMLAGEERGGFDASGDPARRPGPGAGQDADRRAEHPPQPGWVADDRSDDRPHDRTVGGADGGGDEGGARLADLVDAMVAMDRAAARAVTAARQLDVDRVVAEEGMDHQAALRLHTRATRGEVSVVCEAARVLASMPATANLFDLGVLSWGHVRALTAGVRPLVATQRAALDAHLAAHADRLARLDGDGRLGAIDDAIDRHTAPERLADREDADLDTRRLILSPRLDGSGTLFGDLDVEGSPRSQAGSRPRQTRRPPARQRVTPAGWHVATSVVTSTDAGPAGSPTRWCACARPPGPGTRVPRCASRCSSTPTRSVTPWRRRSGPHSRPGPPGSRATGSPAMRPPT